MAAPIFMDAWNTCVLSAGKPHAHKIPRFRGGNFGFFGGEGGKCRFDFHGREDFSDFLVVTKLQEHKSAILFEALKRLREAKPGGLQTRAFPTFFRERSRLCRVPFRDCSS